MSKKNRAILFLLLIMLGKITGFGKELLLSYFHGASELTDAFYMANSLASLFYASLYLTIPVIIIPYCSRMSDEVLTSFKDSNIYSVFQSFFIISIIITVFISVFAEDIVPLFFPNSSENTVGNAVDFLTIVSFTFIFSTIVACLNNIQVVNGRRFSSVIVPVANNAAFIIALFMFSTGDTFVNVIWAALISWVILALFNIVLSKDLYTFKLTWSFPLLTDKKLLMIFMPALLAFYIEQINNYISVFFSSGLGEGSVSIISYANKINLVVVSVFIVVLNAYIFPKLAASRYESGTNGIQYQANRIFRWILILSAPLVVVLFVNSNQIISLLFERGAFDSGDVKSVAAVLGVISMSLPLLLIRDLLSRIIYSFNNSILTMYSSIVTVVLHIISTYFLTLKFQLIGVAFGFLLSVLINLILLFVFLKYRYSIVFFRDNINFIVKNMLSVVLALFIFFVFRYLFSIHWMLECSIFVLLYLCFLSVLNVSEITIIRDKLKALSSNS